MAPKQEIKYIIKTAGGEKAAVVFARTAEALEDAGEAGKSAGKKVASGMDEGQRATHELGDQAKHTGGVFQTAMGNLAAQSVEALVSSMRTLIGRGAELVGMSAGLAETQSKFNTVFGESRSEVQGFIDEWASMAGLTGGEAQELLATTGAIAQGAGLAEKESAGLSKRVAKLAGDLASFNDAAPQETFEAVQAGLTGEREQLKKYGIVLKEAEVQQRALRQTGKATTDSLTQREKALASVALMYEKAGRQVGDLARTSDSAANIGKQSEAAWASLAETAANQLLPAAREINTELLKLAEREDVGTFVRETAAALSDLLVDGMGLLSDVIDLFMRYGDEVKWGAQATLQIVGAITAYRVATQAQALASRAATIAQRGLNASMKANPVGLVVSALSIVLPLLYQFRDRVAEAGAVFLDFSAKTVRATGFLVDKMQELLKGVPDWVPGIQSMRTAVVALDVAVDKSADGLERGADRLRSYGKGVRAGTDAAEESSSAVSEHTEKVKENTRATEESAQATADNVAAKKEEASAFVRARTELEKFEAKLAMYQQADIGRLAVLRKQTEQIKKQIEFYERAIEYGAQDVDPVDPLERSLDSLTRDGVEVPGLSEEQREKIEEARQAMRDLEGDGRMTMQSIADAAAQSAGNFASAFETAFQIAGEENEAFFRAYQATAVAEAIASTYLAANKALASAPPPFNFALAASVVATGLANVARIVTASPAGGGASGRQEGRRQGAREIQGYASGTDHAARGVALVGEEGPELVSFRGGERVLTNENTEALTRLAAEGLHGVRLAPGSSGPGRSGGGAGSHEQSVRMERVLGSLEEVLGGLREDGITVGGELTADGDRLYVGLQRIGEKRRKTLATSTRNRRSSN